MYFLVFSSNSNPVVDAPLCRKSRAYVEDLLERKEATMLGEDLRAGVKLRSRRTLVPFTPFEMAAALTDWRTVPVSFLPGGKVLVITTKQLRTA